ncbi:Hypothetical predicted protein [Olea europaea subsp. europaea]|uniref:Uncharacterized protein n=1 Tax=Olea europaea subsp. europaea TaxID=158383 RepID=A0A8S0TUG4_OLEEU|nr:Hypothetical predicted protein [Olea europaea subsp. europaea]
MVSEYFAKVAVATALSGLVFNGSKSLNLKSTPLSSLSVVELDLLISSISTMLIFAQRCLATIEAALKGSSLMQVYDTDESNAVGKEHIHRIMTYETLCNENQQSPTLDGGHHQVVVVVGGGGGGSGLDRR